MPSYRELLDLYEAGQEPSLPEFHPANVIGWVAYDGVPGSVRIIGGSGGFIEKGNRWKTYIEGVCEEEGMSGCVPHYEALKRAILQRGLKRGGDWHQNSPEGVPVFGDGAAGMFSMRGWGDLMAAVWAEQENRDYGYMDFYMDSQIPEDSTLVAESMGVMARLASLFSRRS